MPASRRVVACLFAGLLLGGLPMVAAPVADPTEDAVETDRAVLPTERPHIRLQRLPRRPRLEEFLDMAPPPDLVAMMTRVTGFVQQEPEDGRPASQEADVWLGYDDTDLHVVWVAFDDDPDQVRARLAPREQPFGDETVEIMLDTFNDQRRAMAFLTNPYGVQWDAIWTEGSGGGTDNFDSAWDTVWYSEGRITDRGYVVLMSIPFKSLRFNPEGEQTWGMILVRDIPRNNETSFWPRVSNRIEGRLNQAATMGGLEDISPGRNAWIIPYGTARHFELLDEDQKEFVDGDEYDAGLDAKFVLRDRLTLDLTANPDFSQIESDQPQITVNQRFEVFFPERRPFFLENKDFFATPIDLVFTRRIADPSMGARLTGKLGAWRLGTLVIDDEAPGELAAPGDPGSGDAAWNGIFRVSRDVGAQSNVGLLMTTRDFEDRENFVGSLDGRIKLSDNWETKFQAAWSSTVTWETPPGGGPEVRDEVEDDAYSLEFNRQGRKVEAHAHYIEYGPDFRTDLGFVPRTDIRNAHTNWEYNFRPEAQWLVAWGPSLYLEYAEDYEGLRLDRKVNPGLFWNWRRETRLSVNAWESRERLRTSDFPELDTDTDFDTSGVGLSFGTSWLKSVSVEGSMGFADAINFVPPAGEAPLPAERMNANLDLTLRPGRRTRVDGTWLFAALDDAAGGGRIFTNQIWRGRLNWQWDTQLSARFILQYDETETNPGLTDLETTRNWNADLLFTYLINPWTAIYVGYNTNFANLEIVPGAGPAKAPDDALIRVDDDYLNNAEQVFVKISYLFRL